MLNLSSFFISKELMRRGFTVTGFYDNDLLLIEKNGKKFYTHASITVQQTTAHLICKDKFLSKEVLRRFGFPTPKGIILTKATLASLEAITSLQFPIALKPLNLSGGVGVSVNISSLDEVKTYLETHPNYDKVLAEEMLSGKDTRILVVRGKFFAACQREPASIVGDGVHTIEEIVATENIRRAEIQNKQDAAGEWIEDIFPILFDTDAKKYIEQSGFQLTTVPQSGQKIFVRANANVASGGSSVDVTDDVCPEIRLLCENVAQALNMTTIGVDLMSENLSQPLDRQERAGIVEINGSPGLSLHTLTHIGTRRDPSPLIVDEIEEVMSKL